MNISVFISCCVDQFSPQTGKNLIRLLESLGYNVKYPIAQTCCGRILYDNGNWAEARALGEKFIENFKDSDYIIGCSASCVGYIKNNLGKLFFNSPNHNIYKSIKNKVMDISEFLCNVDKTMSFDSVFPYKVHLHSNCHSLNEYNLETQTREILKNVKDIILLEENPYKFCCGYGGGLSLYNPHVSIALAEQKLKSVLEEDAEFIVSNDLSCLLHLQSQIEKNKYPLRTIHLVDLLMYNK